MATTAEAFQIAIAHHQAGRLREAEAIYRQILQIEPQHADAVQLLGLVAHQLGQHEVAVTLIRRAIGLRADQPAFHSNLAEAYRALGKLAEAGLSLRDALRLDANLPEAHNNLGNVLRSTGQVEEAAAAFRTAIRLRPRFAEPHHNLGLILQTEGDLEGAIACYRRAIELNPAYADAYSSLGAALTVQGVPAASIECYRQALQLAPHNSEFHLNLGTVYQGQQQLDQAASCYREALRLNPQLVLAHNNLGAVLKEQGRLDEAIAAYREAVRIQPDFHQGHFNLGIALHEKREPAAAVAAYEEALRLKPDYPEAMVNCGLTLQGQDRWDEALALFDRALMLKPDYALAHFNRGNALKTKRMGLEAIAAYQVALRLQPNYPTAYANMAVVFMEMAQPDRAVEACRAGLERAPDDGLLYGNLAIALHHQGRGDEAIAAYRKAIELRPDDAAGHSNLLYSLNFQPDADPGALFAEHREWAARFAEPLTAAAPPHTNDRTPRRRLRIGYLSPFFREHAVCAFAEPMIVAHDHEQFEIFCYSDMPAHLADATTARLRAAVDRWRDVTHDSDAEIAALVRSDAIDILVDLTGHIGGNRLLTFARKPAPIQVTYLGYQNTTGMSAMDYRLTDERADPPGLTDGFYTERLVRLPRSFFCYRPPDAAQPVTPLPAAAAGFVTFGSFNNPPKITRPVIEAWLQILARVPDSRLLLLAYRGGDLERRVHGQAQALGIDPRRVDLHDRRSKPDYLLLQQQADIALDPFPFNGHTTTCDSTWMGLPVVMLEGATYASRFGGSVLANLGLDELIARSVEQYIETAASLAGDLPRLARLRSELRPRMAASALLDFAGFTRNLEQAYRQMWRTWCDAGANAP